jgi:predicted site-specific integrase-resolvase
MMSITKFDLIATRDVCKICDRSEATIRLWVRSGKLRAIRLPSGQNVFRRADVEQLMNEHRAEAIEPAPAA